MAINLPLLQVAGGILSGENLSEGLGRGLLAAGPAIQRQRQAQAAQGLLGGEGGAGIAETLGLDQNALAQFVQANPGAVGGLLGQAAQTRDRAATRGLAQRRFDATQANQAARLGLAERQFERAGQISPFQEAQLGLGQGRLDLARETAGRDAFVGDKFGRVLNTRTGVLTGEPVPSAVTGKITAAERRVGNFANRMLASETALRKLGPQTEGILARNTPVGANFLRSGEGRRYRGAARRWLGAFLRKESGATIKPDEFEQDFQNFFPQPGDDSKTRQDKQAARLEVMQATIREAGGGFTNQAGFEDLQTRVRRNQQQIRGKTLGDIDFTFIPGS